ncbi:MAG: hypothetical protein ACUBOA_01215 [Candidatus Loosdrechtia sp.]|uniref:hypothetical protein n=1 Tax=Candidatus Loosdrechtia sp. TaxID=3101272 RepID=UPI003A679702|nr:MAG: hypothetical protein QY305_04750 [Candidatus Jettenia sp. AMX2]
MKNSSLLFLGVLLCLALTVFVCLSAESLNTGEKTRLNSTLNFQQIVHGLGMGATTKPAWCYINFDPRIDPWCTCIEWPVPGGFCYCPDHTGSVSYTAGNMEMGAIIEIVKNDK